MKKSVEENIVMKRTLTLVLVLSVPVSAGLFTTGCQLEVPADADPSGAGPPGATAALEALETEPWGEPHAVLAEVNGRPISRGEFYLRVLRRFGTWKLLTGMIKEELFLQEAQRLGLSVTDDERDAAVGEILAARAQELPGGFDEMEAMYQREGMDLAAVRRDLEREVSTQLLIGKVTRASRRVDEAALREYYQQTYRHQRYETRHVAYSYMPRSRENSRDPVALKQEAEERAQRAAERIRSGADFEAIARAESDDKVTATRGGALGEVHEESPMAPSLKRAIFSLGEGGVSDPVENLEGGGYHVFQVTRILPSESFVDCTDRLRQDLEQREPDLREIEQMLEGLRSRAQIRVLNSPLAARNPLPAADGK